MSLEAYRQGQGFFGRATAASAMMLVVLFGTFRLWQVGSDRVLFPFLGVQVQVRAAWAAAWFLVSTLLVLVVVSGVRTGLGLVDRQTRVLIDLLVDTQGELQKVAWPSKQELTNSTIVVIITVVILGVFLVCVDGFVSYVMIRTGVLPAPH